MSSRRRPRPAYPSSASSDGPGATSFAPMVDAPGAGGAGAAPGHFPPPPSSSSSSAPPPPAAAAAGSSMPPPPPPPLGGFIHRRPEKRPLVGGPSSLSAAGQPQPAAAAAATFQPIQDTLPSSDAVMAVSQNNNSSLLAQNGQGDNGVKGLEGGGPRWAEEDGAAGDAGYGNAQNAHAAWGATQPDALEGGGNDYAAYDSSLEGGAALNGSYGDEPNVNGAWDNSYGSATNHDHPVDPSAAEQAADPYSLEGGGEEGGWQGDYPSGEQQQYSLEGGAAGNDASGLEGGGGSAADYGGWENGAPAAGSQGYSLQGDGLVITDTPVDGDYGSPQTDQPSVLQRDGSMVLSLDFETPSYPALHGRRRSSSGMSHASYASKASASARSSHDQFTPHLATSPPTGSANSPYLAAPSLGPISEAAAPEVAIDGIAIGGFEEVQGDFQGRADYEFGAGNPSIDVGAPVDPYANNNAPSYDPGSYGDYSTSQLRAPQQLGFFTENSTIAPSVTTLTTSTVWVIDNFSTITDDKVVSFPFGPKEWRWQLVVYPHGMATAAGYFSAFLRPLRNMSEVEAGADWVRPIFRFSIRVHKPGYSRDELEDPESILVQETSLSSFTGFSNSVPGWGFSTLIDTETLLASGVDRSSGTDSVRITATVESVSMPSDWVMHELTWTLPAFYNTLLEWSNSTADPESDLSSCAVLSPTFGPDGNQWAVKLDLARASTESSGHCISGHLQPVLNESESTLPDLWFRSISSFTFKLFADGPLGSYGGDRNSQLPLVAKSLTGGFTFNAAHQVSSWPNLLDLNQLLQALTERSPQHPSAVDVRIVVQVTWEVVDVAAAADARRLAALATRAWNADADARYARANLEAQIDALQADVAAWRGEFDSVTLRANALAKELEGAREDLAVAKRSEIKALELRGRLSRLHLSMSGLELGAATGDSSNVGSDAADDDPQRALATKDVDVEEVDPDELRTQFLRVRAKLYAVEAELADTRESLRILNAERADAQFASTSRGDPDGGAAQLRPPPRSRSRSRRSPSPGAGSGANGPPSDSDEVASMPQAIDTVREEIRAVLLVLEEAEGRSADAGEAERAALRADLAMAHAELEVARASLIDAATHPSHSNVLSHNSALRAEYNDVARETNAIVVRLDAARAVLDRADGISVAAPPIAITTTHPPPPPTTSLQSHVRPPPPPMAGATPSLEMQQALETARDSEARARAELAQYVARVRAARELLAAEADGNENTSTALAALASPTKTSAPGLPFSIDTAHAARSVKTSGGDAVPEPWTPVEGADGGSGLASAELRARMKALERNGTQKVFSLASLISTTIVLLLTFFLSSASLKYVCFSPAVYDDATASPSFNTSLSPAAASFCAVAVPAVDAAYSGWTAAADHLATAVLPHAADRVSRGVERVAAHVKKQQEAAAEAAAARAAERERERLRKEEELAAAAARRRAEMDEEVRRRVEEAERAAAAMAERAQREAAERAKREEEDKAAAAAAAAAAAEAKAAAAAAAAAAAGGDASPPPTTESVPPPETEPATSGTGATDGSDKTPADAPQPPPTPQEAADAPVAAGTEEPAAAEIVKVDEVEVAEAAAAAAAADAGAAGGNADDAAALPVAAGAGDDAEGVPTQESAAPAAADAASGEVPGATASAAAAASEAAEAAAGEPEATEPTPSSSSPSDVSEEEAAAAAADAAASEDAAAEGNAGGDDDDGYESMFAGEEAETASEEEGGGEYYADAGEAGDWAADEPYQYDGDEGEAAAAAAAGDGTQEELGEATDAAADGSQTTEGGGEEEEQGMASEYW
ncbi:hypothetical protein DFJ73DRAFT_799135 [Zopfochytrium polystomum]|nr:hypothetical protein DFJ73DRAFT_799135 [Zopfochytrium polystomum]